MVYAIIGRRRQGKSTLMRHMGSRIPARLIFDPRRMYHYGPGAVVVTTTARLQVECDRMLDQEVAEVVFSPAGDLDRAFLDYSAEMKRWVEEEPTRAIVFMIDEANKEFIDTDNADFMWVVRCCTWEIHQIMLTAHRPVDLTTKVRAMVDHWCWFAVKQEHDLGVVRERCSSEVAGLVQQLAPREFLHWDDTESTWVVVRDSESWRCQIGGPSQIELPGDDGAAGLHLLPGEKPAPPAPNPQGKLAL